VVHLITGGAGFIASHLVSALLLRGHDVVVFDNLALGNLQHLDAALASGHCTFMQIDCANLAEFRAAVGTSLDGRRGFAIWHLAANSDIPAGITDPHIDLRDTFLTTFNALLVMREFAIPEFHFASSSAVYGDFGDLEISEHAGPCQPISNYGAMKLASEGQICAALESRGRRASIFRFPNVVGTPATHGVILDFVNKLRVDKNRLPVLGDGTQQKAYLHVDDLIAAMLFIAEVGPAKINLYNIGPRDAGVTVRFIAECVREVVSPGAEIIYGRGNRGWVGDVPRFRYATDRLAKLGWEPSLSSEAAVRRAVRDVAASFLL
jgi:UDP-glucose 4-epimerase